MGRSWYRRDEIWLLIVAIGISIAAYLFFYSQGTTLGYKDNVSHLEIGRRIVVGQKTGFGQLGGIWLPLQHVFIMLTAWNDYMYLTGLSGAVVSMASYVVSVLGVFKIVWHLTDGKRSAAWSAAIVFGLSANMLFLQATSMGETLMYACIILMVLYVMRWAQTDHYGWLVAASVASLALTYTRYEGWIMAATAWFVVLYTCIRRGDPIFRGNQKGQGLLLVFGFFMSLGVASWLLWNQLIFGHYLNWLNGEYGSKDQVSTQVLNQVGDWRASALTYWYGVQHVVTLPLVLLALAGLLFMLWREKLSPVSVVVMSPLVMAPFFVWGLHGGNQPMRVAEIDGDLYNLRFGVVMVIPAAIFIGYLIGLLPARRALRPVMAAVLCAGVAMLTLSAFADDGKGIITHVEAQAALRSQEEQAAVGAFIANQTEGRVLMESFNNERVLFPIQERVIYEGSQDLWSSSLIDPTGTRNRIDVIVMRTMADDPDLVFQQMAEKPVLYHYKEVLRTQNYLIYRKKGVSFLDQFAE